MKQNQIGMLKTGLKVGEEVHKEFELRAPNTGDLIDAEADCDVGRPLGFSAALIARQLVRIGTYKGPFMDGIIRKLDTRDFSILSEAQRALDSQGEDEQHG